MQSALSAVEQKRSDLRLVEDKKKKGKTIEETKAWCHCGIHNIDYPCADGCPKCK
jgi:hypothetical protein